MEAAGLPVGLVVGGCSGIGAAACLALAQAGLSVAAADLDRSAADRVVAELPGHSHRGYSVDVSDEAATAALFVAAEANQGPIAVLVWRPA